MFDEWIKKRIIWSTIFDENWIELKVCRSVTVEPDLIPLFLLLISFWLISSRGLHQPLFHSLIFIVSLLKFSIVTSNQVNVLYLSGRKMFWRGKKSLSRFIRKLCCQVFTNMRSGDCETINDVDTRFRCRREFLFVWNVFNCWGCVRLKSAAGDSTATFFWQLVADDVMLLILHWPTFSH